MATDNYIRSEGNTLPSVQPTAPGFWLDGGVLTFFNGSQNNTMDFNEGPRISVFGTDLGDI